jgi:hypothetical protein
MLRMMTIRDFRNTPSKLWRSLRTDRAVALSVNGVPKALILGVEGGDIESVVTLVRQVRAKEALMRLRTQAAAKGADQLSDADIEAEITAMRRGRRRK